MKQAPDFGAARISIVENPDNTSSSECTSWAAISIQNITTALQHMMLLPLQLFCNIWEGAGKHTWKLLACRLLWRRCEAALLLSRVGDELHHTQLFSSGNM